MNDRWVGRLVILLMVLVGADICIEGVNFYDAHFRKTKPRPITWRPEAPTSVNVSGRQMLGDTNQRKVLIELSDYECPFCTKYATGVHKDIRQRFVEGGKIRYVFLNNPLPIHPHSRLLASASLCAANQNQFLRMHDNLFQVKPRDRDGVIAIARDLALDMAQFTACLDRPEIAAQIDADIAEAHKLGLRATPSFAFGTIKENGDVDIQEFMEGNRPINDFENAMARLAGR